jgi:hypothetical protein
MNLNEARTEALTLANTRRVNHVIVKLGADHFVYTKMQYPNRYLEEVAPTLTSESIEPLPELNEVKKRVKKGYDAKESEVL